MSKPCEYCGVDLPLGVDKGTRRVRSFHFASCEKRPKTTPPSMDIEAQRDALLEALKLARPYISTYTVDGYHAEVKADAVIKAVEGDKEAHWQAVAQEAQKHFDEGLKKFEGEKE